MTKKTTPTDLHPEDLEHARSYVEDYLDATYAPDRTLAVARVLHALLPTPPHPTLADMTYQERAACQWMQCDVIGFRGKYALVSPSDRDGDAVLLGREGEVHYEDHAMVVPRPDLPRLSWPGDKNPAPAVPALPDGWRLADHEKYGRVVVTNPTPGNRGYVYFVFPSDGDATGYGWFPGSPDELTYLDTSEAVPPNTLAVGSVWVGVNALTRACEESGRDQIVVSGYDGYVSVWDNDAEWWEGSVPPRAAPYTIIHAGKGADQ